MSIKSHPTIVLLALTTLLVLCVQTDGQFFTKTSKSIPRMGRRSGEDSTLSNQNRRVLMDILLDDYGPNLLDMLEARASSDDDYNNRAVLYGGNELAAGNEQPFDLVRVPYGSKVGSGFEELSQPSGGPITLSRDERSSAGKSSPQAKEASLALRALNINRYMQHLASGQPLVSYDKLIGTRVSSSGDGDLAAGGQQKYDK